MWRQTDDSWCVQFGRAISGTKTDRQFWWEDDSLCCCHTSLRSEPWEKPRSTFNSQPSTLEQSLPSSLVSLTFHQSLIDPTYLCLTEQLSTRKDRGYSGMCSYLIWPSHSSMLQFTLKRVIVGLIRGQTGLTLAANRPDVCVVRHVRYLEGTSCESF